MKRHRKFSVLLGDGSASNSGHTLGVDCISHSSDGSQVITGGRDATVRLWENGVNIATHADHADTIHDVAAIPHSTSFLSCSSDNTMLLYQTEAPSSSGPSIPSLACEITSHYDSVRKMALLTPSTLMSASLDGSVCIHDLKAKGGPALVSVFRTPAKDPLFSLSWAPRDGKFVAIAGSALGHLYMIDPRSVSASEANVQPLVTAAHKLTVRDVVFCDGGSKIVTSGADALVKVWDTRSMRSPIAARLHSDAVFAVAAIPGTPVVLSGGRDGMVVATNIVTLESSPIVAARFPVTALSVSPKQILYVGTTSATVDGYVVSTVVPPGFSANSVKIAASGGSPIEHSPAEVITPSKVSLDLDLSSTQGSAPRSHPPQTSSQPTPPLSHRSLMNASGGLHLSISISLEQPPLKRATPLILTDPVARQFEASYVRTVTFASPEEKLTWCTSSALTRPRSLHKQTMPEPDIHLCGSQDAIVSCCLLNDKRHVLTVNAAGHIMLWNMCSQQIVHRFPVGTSMHAALAKSQMETHCPSWCSVECRWGTLCITLSAEMSLDSYVNQWFGTCTKPPLLSEAGTQSESRSIYSMSRASRAALQQAPLLNLCETTVRTVLKEKNVSVVVWSVPPSDGSPRSLGRRLRLLPSYSDAEIAAAVPSWVSALLYQPAKILPSPSLVNGTHNLELIPFQKSLPALKQSLFSIPKRRTIGDVASELVVILKIKLPKTKDLATQIETLRKSTETATNTAQVGWPICDDAAQDTSVVLSTPLTPDEFLEFIPPGDNGQPHPTLVVEPLMMVTTAFFVYKARGSGVLTLWYRKNALLPS